MNQNNKILDIFLMIVVSFFAAFTVGFNKYAIDISSGKSANKLLVMSEILIHGISGLLIGLVFTKFVSDTYILCAISGIGGMIGQKLLHVVAKNFIASIMSIESEKMDEIDGNESDNNYYE